MKEFPAGPKLSMEDVIGLVEAYHRKAMTQERILSGLQKRKLDFSATPENLEQLKQKGTPESILEFIRQLAPPPPPVAVEKPKTPPKLVVTCVPAACEARIGTEPFRKASDGKIVFENIKEPRLILDAQEEGFESVSLIVNIDPERLKPEAATDYTVTLKPNQATQAAWGAEILKRVMAKAALPASPWSVTGTIFVAGAGDVTFNMVAHMSNDGKANVELSIPKGGKIGYSCSGGLCQALNKTGIFGKPVFAGTKEEKKSKETTLSNGISAWLGMEYGAAMGRVASSKFPPRALSPPDQAKEFEVAPYMIELDDQARPASITAPSAMPGTSVSGKFAEYKIWNGLSYPSMTNVVQPGQDKNFVSVTVTEVASQGAAQSSPAK